MRDKALIDRLLRRDARAVAEAQKAYGAYCLGLARRILGSEEDARECVNDAFLKLWNSVPPAAPENLRAYLARLTRNAAFDRYKRDRAAKRGGGAVSAALDELAEILPDAADGPEAQCEYAELKTCVNAFLRTLPARDCDIFLRRYFFAEETCEIAAAFSLKEANVRLILSRTRQKLKNHLTTEGLIYE